MSAIPDTIEIPTEKATAYTAAEFIGNFTKETIQKVGSLTTEIKTFTLIKINSSQYKANFHSLNKTWNQYEETIFKVVSCISCFYNFYTSPVFFVLGTIMGFLASSPIPLIQYDCLQKAHILGFSKADGYVAQKVMTIIAGINIYLGDTFFDNAFGGWFAGGIFGNTLNRYLTETNKPGVDFITNYLSKHITSCLQLPAAQPTIAPQTQEEIPQKPVIVPEAKNLV